MIGSSLLDLLLVHYFSRFRLDVAFFIRVAYMTCWMMHTIISCTLKTHAWNFSDFCQVVIVIWVIRPINFTISFRTTETIIHKHVSESNKLNPHFNRFCLLTLRDIFPALLWSIYLNIPSLLNRRFTITALSIYDINSCFTFFLKVNFIVLSIKDIIIKVCNSRHRTC